jgi:hypothetical protein
MPNSVSGWLVGSVFLSVAAAAGPQLTGLTREHGVDAAWLWFPETATSLTLRLGHVPGDYQLLDVDHARGTARLMTPAGELVLSFATAQESPPLVRNEEVRSVTRRATHNAARALGATTEDVPSTEESPVTIDQIAIQARRRLHPR